MTAAMTDKIKLAVIGSPVEHSLSPSIHARFAKALGIDIEYSRIDVTRDTLADFIKRAADTHNQNCERVSCALDGFNITMPLKEAIIPYLAELDATARECAAVNTVVVRRGGLFGYNTDGAGVVRSLQTAVPDLRGKAALILGAGGAAKAALAALHNEGAAVTILTRRDAAHDVFSAESLAPLATAADIIINATPLGMSRGADSVDFSDLSWLGAIKPGAVILDAVYNPPQTRLLTRARELGITALGGFGMLAYQAQEAFTLFTGTPPPTGLAATIWRELETG